MKYTGKRRYFSLVFSIALLFHANIVQGQGIAPVPSDPAVSSGILPNGMKWYVAENHDMQGTADFALVQMTGSKTIPSVDGATIKEIAKESLMSQPLLTAPTVQEYFIGKGCVPGPEGFAEVKGNATVFRFSGVNLRLSGTVLDSTLLVLVNMAGRSSRSDDLVLKKWYAPSDQAIIVAGDVNAKSVSETLRILSFMVPASESVPRQGYVWKDEPGIKTETVVSQEPGLATVSAMWRLERSPRELMNTVQPVIQEKYMTMAGLVAAERIRISCKEAGIPVAYVAPEYDGGAGTLGDSRFSIEVALSREHAEMALQTVGATMSSICAHGIGMDEAETAAYEFSDLLSAGLHRRHVSNRGYVNRCISAFIYNTPLSSRKEMQKFLSSKDLSPETERAIVHSLASASIGVDKNLTLRYSSDSLMLSGDSLKSVFIKAWKDGAGRERKTGPVEIPHLPSYEGKRNKVGIKTSKKEYVSGGSVWTLYNGIRVVFKNMPEENDMVHYSLSLNGGTASVEGLGAEDGAYLEDYLGSCRIGGVPAKVFKDAARSRGMTLSCDVGHSDTRIYGSVPSDGLDYMMRVLLALMNERQRNDADWKYHAAGEEMRKAAGISSGSGVCMEQGFSERADSFFDSLSGNVNNGVLILVGKIDEKKLKEALTLYAGGFRTSERSFTRAGSMSGNFSGTTGFRRRSDHRSVSVTLAAPMALSAENYYTAAMAAMVLRRHFSAALAEKGMRVDVKARCSRFPQESLTMWVSISEASVDGLSSGTSLYNASDALSVLKDVLGALSSVTVDANVLESYKYLLEKQLSRERQNPEYWMNVLNLRYLAGKDFTTGAESKIRGITEGNIRTLFTTLEENSRMEYIITGN